MPYTINFNLILPRLKAANRKQALSEIAVKISKHLHCDSKKLLDSILKNEDENSSASGDGIAIPNLKLEGLSKPLVALATLQHPVDFEAADGQNVDIICILLSPHSDGPIHLRELARITRAFKDETLREKLRETKDVDTIRTLLVNPEGWLLAA